MEKYNAASEPANKDLKQERSETMVVSKMKEKDHSERIKNKIIIIIIIISKSS
jgi:hypothetical protein